MSREAAPNECIIGAPQWSYVHQSLSAIVDALEHGLVESIEVDDPTLANPTRASLSGSCVQVYVRLREAPERDLIAQRRPRFPVRMGLALDEASREASEELLDAVRPYNMAHEDQIRLHITS